MTEATEDFLQTTRTSYDAIAGDYAARYPSGLVHPLDRSVVMAFAELARGTAPVADLGSGPGYVTALLHEQGVPAFGVDLSPAMVALAREAHPGLRFRTGSMTSLDVPDRSLGGLLALYSTIHVPDARLPGVFAGFHRALAPGAPALLAFQTPKPGEPLPRLHLSERFTHRIALDYYWRSPEQITSLLAEAGLALVATVRREPSGEETRPRAFVLARKA
ncbi:methyltransferase domain-containing protein [Streptomyces sp. NEAU-sy36]|uniref:class I SAM-dependent methyltransferase n=1 Tax=unclassified Streptomyces TaxID=2593676 RepID=UPI0015D59B65|nr:MULTISPECIES: class I SAM-dependent methyltransferase [unclassified Streptomyces]QLJ05286.1 methyltransferase domain-containing protein [Streptomyces sp. NEAU-sy36]